MTEICIIGAGPRGLSVLERLCANERARPSHEEVVVHVVDPAGAGAGAVWRCDQSRHLMTNTVAAQITVWSDDSSRIEGPIEPGPSLYEWALDQPDEEARALGPNSYPSRAFYGRYLQAAFSRVVEQAPRHVTVRCHRSRAIALADTDGVTGGPQGVRLADGTRLHDLDAVVLALGHQQVRPTAREARTASLSRIHHLRYLTPANPADLDLDEIGPGEPVLLRGLGLNFFDHMALLTVGRGGSFVTRPDGWLTYRPSGREPRLYASSRRGVPYQSRGENQKGAAGRHLPLLLTAEYVADLPRPINFTRDLWPVIAREVENVYYTTLLGLGPETMAFQADFLAVPIGGDTTEVLEAYGIAPRRRFSWERLARPYGDSTFVDRTDFQGWLLEHLRADVRAARAGNVEGPLKAALDVLRDLRNEIRLAVDHGGLSGESHRDDLEGWYTPLNGYLSIGPPAVRVEQMIALIEAGVLTLTGPGTWIRLDTTEPAFVSGSSAVPGEPIRSRVLIEARLPEPDLRRTEDPLLRHLLDTDQAVPYRIGSYETGGLAVTERPYRLLDGCGRPHPRRFAYGVPTESVHWVTAAGIRPGVDSVTLADSDAIAREVLGLPEVARVPREVRRAFAEAPDEDPIGVIV
ncbi:FAD/NAD(P)-binding protein [Micromonospora sp. NPDC047134]|uniref:FAD/NAD(P)-binding protein n=1 Tax=Micromonospora sp. NPDC047134 TaxID=3154340 RepID=UPI0033D1FF46